MPAKIDLHLTLPDGDVAARRDYPIDEERRDRSDPARQADEREWVACELPDAIKQLYARAGLEQPGALIDTLLAALPDNVHRNDDTLAAVVGAFPTVRDALHGVAAELGVDLATRAADGRTGTMRGAANLPKLAKQKVGDLRRARENYDRLAAKVAELAAAYPVTKRLSGVEDHPLAVVDATLEALTDRAREIDQRGRVIDAVKTAIGLGSPAVRDNLADEALPAAVERAVSGPGANIAEQVLTSLLALHKLPYPAEPNANEIFLSIAKAEQDKLTKSRAEGRREALSEMLRTFQIPSETEDPFEALLGLYGQQRRMGQLDVLGGLGVEGDQLPADADVVTWAQRARETWYDEARVQPLSELSVTRSYLAMLLNDLGAGDHYQHDKVRSGELGPDALAILVGRGQDAIAEHREKAVEADRLRREMDKILILFGLPQNTSVAEITGRVTEVSRSAVELAVKGATEDAQRHVEEVAALRSALAEIGTVYKVLAPITRNALISGTLAVEDAKSVAAEVQTQLSSSWAELAILRYLAHDVALITGASQADAAKLTNATLPPQQLANRLNEYKRVLRRDGAVAERDASRRIIDDIARKLGSPDLRETLVPGAVGDLVRTVEAQAVVLSGVRGQLAVLRTGLPKCTDEQLPGLVRQTVLVERYPIGATVQLPNGVLGMVVELSADTDSDLSINVRYEDESTIWVRPSEIRGVEHRSMSGEFRAADDVKPKGFALPENGLADILAKVRPPKLPSMDRVDAAADRLADRIETWGERVASRINSAAERLAAEIDEAVENAREKGGK